MSQSDSEGFDWVAKSSPNRLNAAQPPSQSGDWPIPDELRKRISRDLPGLGLDDVTYWERTESGGWRIEVTLPLPRRITHGRHCTCSACAREDWTSADLAPCGMHGCDCPALYDPWGPAGTTLPLSRESDSEQ